MERAVVQAAVRVVQELPAFRTECRIGVVMRVAVNAHHGRDGLIFPSDAWVPAGHCVHESGRYRRIGCQLPKAEADSLCLLLAAAEESRCVLIIPHEIFEGAYVLWV